ncbi:MAG: bifunctional salicylyl-CoA 5-hydroxylase/oxidoreductase [Sterolibacterium sp.]|nr:bifunctional salicylyl-CoA 5-hydroxylase/oxidoreductase [Sterolibacterium sp.]
MRIVCLGGGPAGLYFSILMKLANPAHQITVHERNRADDTFGWGVVFSDSSLGRLADADPIVHARLTAAMRHWDHYAVHFKGRSILSRGHDYCSIARHKLLEILQQRAQELGVVLKFETKISFDGTPESALPAELTDADLIVAADGINSVTRTHYSEHFQPSSDLRKCRFLWLGTTLPLQAFTFISEASPWGWFQAHAYPYAEGMSTFIVECHETTWRNIGLEQSDSAGSAAFCERIFAEHLGGHKLLCNPRHQRGSVWLNFNNLHCTRWHYKNIVLLGDAAHTLHFSIGSGTHLAMEDAIALSQQLARLDDRSTNPPAPDVLSQALENYQQERDSALLRLRNAARNRMEWFENLSRYTRLEPEQFTYSLLTGSQRIGHEKLRQRDPGYIQQMENWLATQCQVAKPEAQSLPPMFTPFRLRGMTLKNRVVVSPMAMYSCENGLPGDFHLAHLGSRLLGGAALVMTEMTAVTAEGRITPGCAGLWNHPQMRAWQRIVDFAHQSSDAKIGLQLGHAGPKGSTQPGWQQADEPLAQDNWPLLAASAIAYGPQNQTPRAMTRQDMDSIRDAFVDATHRAATIGFDLLELHCAHGYLLSSFISPLTNQRDDDYGGSLENRLRYPLEVCRAMRIAWPAERPLAVRISAHDWVPGGLTDEDAVTIARAFRDIGVDLIDVSSGQTSRAARPVYGRMYQTPFADRIRNEAGVATMAVGNIFEADHVNTIIAAGRADLCAIGRPHLANPAWTLHAAASQGYTAINWPRQYLSSKAQQAHIHNLTSSN